MHGHILNSAPTPHGQVFVVRAPSDITDAELVDTVQCEHPHLLTVPMSCFRVTDTVYGHYTVDVDMVAARARDLYPHSRERSVS